MKVIDAHVHLVQTIAGTGEGGALRAIGGGKAIYDDGSVIQLLTPELDRQVTPEDVLAIMDENDVEKAVLLQGNYYGFQNYYTYEAAKNHPDRFIAAAAYDPYSRKKEEIRRHLFEELDIPVVKFEVSVGSGLMCNHKTFALDGPMMMEEADYAEEHGKIFVVDIGKFGTESCQHEALGRLIKAHPDMKVDVCHLLAPNQASQDAALDAIRGLALPNVWFDTAAITHNLRPDAYPYPVTMHFLRRVIDVIGADRLMFATDLPSCLKRDSYRHAIDMFAESDILTEREKQLILHDNAETLFCGR